MNFQRWPEEYLERKQPFDRAYHERNFGNHMHEAVDHARGMWEMLNVFRDIIQWTNKSDLRMPCNYRKCYKDESGECFPLTELYNNKGSMHHEWWCKDCMKDFGHDIDANPEDYVTLADVMSHDLHMNNWW